MSTRGAVAWYDKKGKMQGVYNHFDSYPTGLGAEVWAELVKHKTLKALLTAVQTVGDWRELESGGICQYCGKQAGQPQSISGLICTGFRSERPLTAEEKAVQANIKKTGYPDPQAKWHQHAEQGEASQFDPTRDPLFIEWIYVLCPDRDVIEIWTHVCAYDENGDYRKLFKTYDVTDPVVLEHSPKTAYCHMLLRTISAEDLTVEPDWKAMEDEMCKLNEEIYDREQEVVNA